MFSHTFTCIQLPEIIPFSDTFYVTPTAYLHIDGQKFLFWSTYLIFHPTVEPPCGLVCMWCTGYSQNDRLIMVPFAIFIQCCSKSNSTKGLFPKLWIGCNYVYSHGILWKAKQINAVFFLFFFLNLVSHAEESEFKEGASWRRLHVH